MRIIALGFFDGVHRGHGALLRCARAMADQVGCTAACLTFDRHPGDLLGQLIASSFGLAKSLKCVIIVW